MNAHASTHSVGMMAKVLKVSRSGYYAWRRRTESRRRGKDKELVGRISDIQKKVRYRYGSPRMTAELRREGVHVGHNRVARLMRSADLSARRRVKFRVTTKSGHSHPPAANLLKREFTVVRPNSVWVSDITYIATAEGWMYLCVILDLCGRSVVGWSLSKSLGTDLIIQAFGMAILRRRPVRGLLFHSDRGVQYASYEFRRALRGHGFIQSMSRKGDCWDNACAESFFKTLKTELIGRTIYQSRAAARTAIFEYIEVFYNRQRLHSHLGYRTPVEYEAWIEEKSG